MDMRIVRRVIVGFVLSGFAFVLSGCAEEVVLRESPIWDFPDEVKASLSKGDTRGKVRSILGDPLVEARRYRLEVYRKAGTDIRGVWVLPIPIALPMPGGDEGKVIVLVVYDEDDVVKVIATRLWAGGGTWKIAAGGFHFVNTYGSEPETLLGPSVSWKYLSEMKAVDGRCALVLVNGMCGIADVEQLSLDNQVIINLSSADGFCRGTLNGTYIPMDISRGKHHLSARTKHSQFETEFKCESEEHVYVELEVTSIPDWWWGKRFEGEFSISKTPSKNVIEMGELNPILWHRGTWYDESISPPAGSQ